MKMIYSESGIFFHFSLNVGQGRLSVPGFSNKGGQRQEPKVECKL